MKRKWSLALFLFVGLLTLLSTIGVAAVAGYTLDWWSVDGGGAGSGAGSSSTGGPYSLGGSIGQPDAGTSAGGSFSLTGGFWAVAADLVPPLVVSSVRINPNPTILPSVGFTVTFSKPVSGVDTTDFALTVSGLTDTSVSTVTGGPSAYTVTVSTGSGNGTLRLDVVDNDSIIDLYGIPLGGSGPGNGNFTTGEVYTVAQAHTIFLPLVMR